MKEAGKQYRNQRVARPRQRRQQHLLEVSIRASKAREQRIRRALAVTFKLVLFAALLVGGWIGVKEGMDRFFWNNPTLHLSDVRTSTTGTLTREQIITTAGVAEGRNIFLTDLAATKAALERLPQVERVEVHRTLPNRIELKIEERSPIAWVAAKDDIDPSASENSFLIDARGYVMKSRKLLQHYLLLPIISGVETENLVAGQKVTTLEMQAALDLLRLNADSTRWQIRYIDVSKGYCLVVTDKNRAQITFALDRVEMQLGRLYRLLDHIQQTDRGREIQTVNLVVERNIPVTFAPEVLPDPAELPASDEPTNPEVASSTASSTPPAPVKPITPAATSSRKVQATKPSTTSSTRSRSSQTPSRSSVDKLKKPFRVNGQ